MAFHTNDLARGDEHLVALRALKERYPYMFIAPNIGHDFYRGWLADFIIACDDSLSGLWLCRQLVRTSVEG